jgi:hypothetical protein
MFRTSAFEAADFSDPTRSVDDVVRDITLQAEYGPSDLGPVEARVRTLLVRHGVVNIDDAIRVLGPATIAEAADVGAVVSRFVTEHPHFFASRPGADISAAVQDVVEEMAAGTLPLRPRQ